MVFGSPDHPGDRLQRLPGAIRQQDRCRFGGDREIGLRQEVRQEETVAAEGGARARVQGVPHPARVRGRAPRGRSSTSRPSWPRRFRDFFLSPCAKETTTPRPLQLQLGRILVTEEEGFICGPRTRPPVSVRRGAREASSPGDWTSTRGSPGDWTSTRGSPGEWTPSPSTRGQRGGEGTNSCDRR